jgi:hypothetical protein
LYIRVLKRRTEKKIFKLDKVLDDVQISFCVERCSSPNARGSERGTKKIEIFGYFRVDVGR